MVLTLVVVGLPSAPVVTTGTTVVDLTTFPPVLSGRKASMADSSATIWAEYCDGIADENHGTGVSASRAEMNRSRGSPVILAALAADDTAGVMMAHAVEGM